MFLHTKAFSMKRAHVHPFPLNFVKESGLKKPFSRFFKFSMLPLRSYAVFLFSFFLSISLLYLSRTSSPVLVPLQTFFLETSGALRISMHRVTDHFISFKQVLLNGRSLLEAQQQLEAENFELRQKLISLEHIRQENETLRKSLNVLPDAKSKLMTAPVLSSPLKSWNHCFLIGVGSSSGIQKGQPVFSAYGVVGQVHEVSEHAARVMPLTHRDSRIPVIGLSSRVEAVMAGNGSPYPFLVYLQENRLLNNSEILVTSRYGGKFPPGYRIGHLAYSAQGEVIVHSYIPWHHLEFVHVVMDFPLKSYAAFEKELRPSK